MDQLAHTYTTKSHSKRWLMTVFFNMLDIGGIDAYTVWTVKYPEWRTDVNR
jgi:hypothetical protein